MSSVPCVLYGLLNCRFDGRWFEQHVLRVTLRRAELIAEPEVSFGKVLRRTIRWRQEAGNRLQRHPSALLSVCSGNGRSGKTHQVRGFGIRFVLEVGEQFSVG